jgi:hypothetical protein
MNQRAINLLVLLSLALCIGTAALWVRCRIVGGDALIRDRSRWIWNVSAYGGRLHIVMVNRDRTARDLAVHPHRGWFHQTISMPPTAKAACFSIRHESWDTATAKYHTWRATMPLWSIVAVTAIGPIAWVVARERRIRAKKRGLCAVCGYDLRESPDRCPECGTEVGGAPA